MSADRAHKAISRAIAEGMIMELSIADDEEADKIADRVLRHLDSVGLKVVAKRKKEPPGAYDRWKVAQQKG